jgi:DNA adenine methylase
MKKLSPALRYHGSKWRDAARIIRYFPPHLTFVDNYAGSAAVLLQKAPSRFEVLNDLNGDVTTFFQILRDQPQQLIRAIELTPYSRKELALAFQVTSDPLETARRFYVRSWQGWGAGALKEKKGWRYMHSPTRSSSVAEDWQRTEHLWDIAKRLRQVQIECTPALEILKRMDTPHTLFFLDPPYLPDTRKGSCAPSSQYVFDMDEKAHRVLGKQLQAIQGMVILCGRPSALYDELYAGWSSVSWQSQTNGGGAATECLWLSPKASAALEQVQLNLELTS